MTRAELQPHLDHLKALPFVQGLRIDRKRRGVGDIKADARLCLRTPGVERCLLVEYKRSHVSRPLVQVLMAHRKKVPQDEWILFAPYVGPAVGRDLRALGVNYVDAVGNCSLRLDEKYVALIEGKRLQTREPLAKAMRGPGHKVIFALLAKPDLLNTTVREIGEAAGVGKTTAAQTIRRLESERTVGVDQKGRHILNPRALLERWIAAYSTGVRPRLFVGRYRAPDQDPNVLEERVSRQLEHEKRMWAWGGGAAAMRLTGHYRGPETVLHVERADPDMRQLLKAVPSRDGKLIIVGVPGPVAFEGARKQTVHPLLVYSELLVSDDERAQDAAEMIRERYLESGRP